MQQVTLAGVYDHAVDDKGRLTLPARYRDSFREGAKLVRLVGREPCLLVFQPESWADFDAKYLAVLDPFAKPEDDWKLRDIYMNLHEVMPDRQGRILLPSNLAGELGLSGKVRIVGNRTHLEIWNPATLAERELQSHGS